jgi:hypothetical protein
MIKDKVIVVITIIMLTSTQQKKTRTGTGIRIIKKITNKKHKQKKQL